MNMNKNESVSPFGLLRLTEARSGARVCDPQHAVFLFVRGFKC